MKIIFHSGQFSSTTRVQLLLLTATECLRRSLTSFHSGWMERKHLHFLCCGNDWLLYIYSPVSLYLALQGLMLQIWGLSLCEFQKGSLTDFWGYFFLNRPFASVCFWNSAPNTSAPQYPVSSNIYQDPGSSGSGCFPPPWVYHPKPLTGRK